MELRAADAERRSGIHWLIAAAFVLALMLGAWWLVESTNREGEHDAQLLPFFALIPLSIGLYRVIHSRYRHESAVSGGRRQPHRPDHGR